MNPPCLAAKRQAHHVESPTVENTVDQPIEAKAKSDRIPTFQEFWPYYLSEHRVARDRWLHFLGTSGFLLSLLVSTLNTPGRVGVALILCAGAILGGFGMEGQRSAAPILIGTIIAMAIANPMILGGVVFAYACAWAGHFLVEHNRPATFVYPLWSLAGDFKMYGGMWAGRYWQGDPTRG